ncbi:hypothetical protein NIES4105_59830 [Calothrix sp. NIES-4105]|nr:hypothetical protein NIES4105_59830 [Calothrix sp. NIES-4105]
MSKLPELQQMFRKLLPLLVISISGLAVLPVSNSANAQVALTKAVIQDLRNLVQLMPQRQPKRKAQRSDAMTPGDGLSTGRLSLADLRFNDNSLARVGEQAVFKFLPRTRNFTLNNGTVLLLIPPGRGRTNIRTPSAAAAIRGSALFVRYDKATDTTVVGALTNSGIEVFNKDASSSQVLQAGQMMVVVKGKFQGLYDFDLRTFYDTSDLVRGLDLTKQNPTGDPALDSVRAETSQALAKQLPISGPGTIKDPSFIKLSTPPEETQQTSDTAFQDTDKVDSILDKSQIQPNFNQADSSNNSTNEANNNSSTSVKNVPNPSVTTQQRQPSTGTGTSTITTPTQPQTPVNPPSSLSTGTSTITTPTQPQTPVNPPSSPSTGTITTPTQPQTPVNPPSPPGTGTGTIPTKPETPINPPSSPGTGTGTIPTKPETPINPPSPPGTGTGTIPTKPETPINPPSPPGTGTDTIPTKPETPITPPSTPGTGTGTIPTKPETPVTPPSTPGTGTGTIPTKPETPVTPPSTPGTGTGTIPTKPETPVTPNPPSDATTDPSTRPST